MTTTVLVRPLDARSPAEVALVAARMGATLVEVLGAERAATVHTPDEIRERLLWHLDPVPGREAAALVACDDDGALVGHTLLRVHDEQGRRAGLFATLHVLAEARRRGVAGRLVDAGEAWMRARGLDLAMTWTDAANRRLELFFGGRGYASRAHGDEWLILSREL